MRRDPLNIHLYDKPERRRSYTQHSVAEPDYGSALLSCAAIALFVGLFFWAYDAIAHRESPFVPAMTTASAPRSSTVTFKLTPPQAPAPDLHSPAVLLANADVPATTTASVENAAPLEQEKANTRPKKKRVHAAKRLPHKAAEAYAAEPGFFRLPFGGF
jgi:hypothetical protein